MTDEDIPLESDETRSGFVIGDTFEIKPVTYSVVEETDPDTGATQNLAVFEGCCVLSTVEQMEALVESVREIQDTDNNSGEPGALPLYENIPGQQDGVIEFGVGITGRRYRWPRGIVPYEIHSALPNQRRVTDAIAHWEQNTKIRFVKRTAANAAAYPNYIRFRSASGCWSYVGMQGNGQQDIGLAAGCGTGSTIHEIGHAIGHWHEQSREDRNDFIRVNFANITPGREHNFNQHITDGDDYGRYDYDSIMHYGPTAFSRNGQPTIVPVDPNATIGQRSRLSRGDIATVRSMYPNLEQSRSWVGTQFRGSVRAGQEQCWFTHSWPAHWHVNWNVVPISPARDAGAQIEWNIKATRQSDTSRDYGALIKYFVCVKNLVNYNVNVEARYQVSGWQR